MSFQKHLPALTPGRIGFCPALFLYGNDFKGENISSNRLNLRLVFPIAYGKIQMESFAFFWIISGITRDRQELPCIINNTNLLSIEIS